MTSELSQISELVRLSDLVKTAEDSLRIRRQDRDQMFLDLYEGRVISVTEMARIAGIRRESVHDALNKQRKANE